MISCFCGRPRLFPWLPQLCSTSPLRLSSWQATPVLSLGSDLWNLSPGTKPPPALCAWRLKLVGTGQHWPLCRVLSLFLCTPVAVLISEAPNLSYVPAHEGFQVCRNFSSFIVPSQRHRSHLDPLSLFLFLLPYLFCGDKLSLLKVRRLLPAINWCSVRGVPHADVFLTYLWEARWYSCLTTLSSWRSSPRWSYKEMTFYRNLNLTWTLIQINVCINANWQKFLPVLLCSHLEESSVSIWE